MGGFRELPHPELRSMIGLEFRATGMSYRERDIRKVAEPNPEYRRTDRKLIEECFDGQRIFKYDFSDAEDVKLIPEPKNQYDPNAIAVYVDGCHVGYVKKTECSKVRKLIESPDFAEITLDMGGGPYKEIDLSEEVVDDGFLNYYVHFTIYMNWDRSQIPEAYLRYSEFAGMPPVGHEEPNDDDPAAAPQEAVAQETVTQETRAVNPPPAEPEKSAKPKHRILRYILMVFGIICIIAALAPEQSAELLILGVVIFLIATRIGRKPKAK